MADAKAIISTLEKELKEELTKRENVEELCATVERDANTLRNRVSALESFLKESNNNNLALKKLGHLRKSKPNNDAHGDTNDDGESHYENNGEAGGDSNNPKHVIKEKSLNPNFETFNGDNNSNVNDWLYMLNDHFDACNIADERKLRRQRNRSIFE